MDWLNGPYQVSAANLEKEICQMVFDKVVLR